MPASNPIKEYVRRDVVKQITSNNFDLIFPTKDYTSNLPIALMGVTAVLKKRTELTMTTTRFTQFPTECVTGDTLCNII